MYPPVSYRRAGLIVIILACATWISIELVTRTVLVKISRVEMRQIKEYENTVRIPSHPASGRRLLVVGNSLLLEGVDFPALTTALKTGWSAQRFVVDDTSYYDWYYGLRRLYGEGAKYDAVALVLTAQQLTASRVRGSYFARRLMSPPDFFAVARDVGMHPTEAVDLFFSSISEFYGLRSELRKVLLGRLMPGLPSLTARFNTYPRWMPDSEQIYRMSIDRLSALRDLSNRFGTRFLLVIPPISRSADLDGSRDVLRAGTATGVTILIPIPSGSLPTSQYSDGFHLNNSGAKHFTTAFVSTLNDTLSAME